MPRVAQNERGSAFIIVAIFLATLLLFVGMATDFGIVLRHRRAMQNACDFAVLAGAQDLKGSTRTATATAQTFAQRDLTENNIAWNPNDFSAETQDKNGNADGIDPVRLWASYQMKVPLFFLASAVPSITVKVQCAAQRVPVQTTGLKPVGLDVAVYNARWTAQGNAPCPLFGAAGNPNAFGSTPCGDCALSIRGGGPQNSGALCDTTAQGSGNAGSLDLQNSGAGCTNNGFDVNSGWGCTFVNGSGTNPAYCATPSAQSTNTSNSPSCSIVNIKTGMGTGPWGSAVGAVCNTPDPVTDPRTSGWVVVMPLMNSATWQGQLSGKSTSVNIVGFAAFELDCTYMKTNGYEPMVGTFVQALSSQGATGNPNGADTGVETIILVR